MPQSFGRQATYGVAYTVYFTLEDPLATGSDKLVTGTIAGLPIVAGDVKISKDGGAAANTTNLPTQVTAAQPIYALVLTATEMEAEQVLVTLQDQTAGAAWRSATISVQTTFALPVIRRSKSTAGAAGTITLDGSASAIDDFYNEMTLVIVGGTGIGQARTISDYVGATKVASVSRNWVTNPDATSVFIILAGADVWDQLEGAEPTAVPADGASFRTWFKWVYRLFTNKNDGGAGTHVVYKADGTTALGTAAVANSGTVISKGKFS